MPGGSSACGIRSATLMIAWVRCQATLRLMMLSTASVAPALRTAVEGLQCCPGPAWEGSLNVMEGVQCNAGDYQCNGRQGCALQQHRWFGPG